MVVNGMWVGIVEYGKSHIVNFLRKVFQIVTGISVKQKYIQDFLQTDK